MSKEYLEALKILKTPLHNEWLRFYPQFKELDEKTKIVDGVRMVSSDADAFLTIEQALQRLESIDNAKPSEALNITKATEKYTGIDLSIVKQSLLKAQEDKKILDILKRIIKVKKSDVYEFVLVVRGTDEEEDTIKEWLG